MVSMSFMSYATSHYSSNTEILLLTCSPTQHPQGLSHHFGSVGIIQSYAFPQHSPGLSKAFLKGLPFMLYFISVTVCFSSLPTVATTPLSQGKL